MSYVTVSSQYLDLLSVSMFMNPLQEIHNMNAKLEGYAFTCRFKLNNIQGIYTRSCNEFRVGLYVPSITPT